MAEVKDKTKNKNADTRFKCKFPGCDKTYKYDGKRKREHEASHGLPPVSVMVHTEKNQEKR